MPELNIVERPGEMPYFSFAVHPPLGGFEPFMDYRQHSSECKG